MDVRELAKKYHNKKHGCVTFKVKEHILKFIKKKNVKAGSTRVPVYKLYYEYYYWTGYRRWLKLDPIEFGRQISKFFDKTRSGAYRYYLLEVPEFDMSKEALKIAKRFYKKHCGNKRRRVKEAKAESSKSS